MKADSNKKYAECVKISGRRINISKFIFLQLKLMKKNQKVPGTNLPYIVHLSLVSMEVMAALATEHNLDGDIAVQCALLHDTIEDPKVSYTELKDEFGEEVADGVQALTKDDDVKKENQMKDSLKRIKQQRKEIWMVKMADRITNLQRPPEDWKNEKRIKYLDQARLIHDELKDSSKYLASRLKDKIKNYRSYIGGNEQMGSD